MATCIVDGLATSYEIIGDGESILWLHGWGDTKETFNGLLPKFNRYRNIILDLPGFGATQPPKEDWGLDGYATFCRNFCQKLDIKPSIVIGHSNGGAIAIKAISENLLIANKLVLLASSGIRNDNTIKKQATKGLAKVAKAGLVVLPKNKSNYLKRSIYSKLGSDINVAPRMEGTFKKIIKDDIQKSAENISTSTLLIYGKEDNATPVKHGQILNSLIQNSKLIVIDGQGHFLHQNSLVPVFINIEKFLNE